MTTLEVNVPCPRCHESFRVPLEMIGPGKPASCPACGASMTFAGQDASAVQRAIDQLEGQIGAGSVKVTVKTRVRRPWWRFWGGQ